MEALKPQKKLAYSVIEVAKMLGISRGKAYELVNSRNGPAAFRVGNRILIPEVALERWVNEQAKIGG
jgi:excisionase family DNA binding protein